MRTPAIGMPASASACVTTAAPAELVPFPDSTRPSCFKSISAVKLSLSRSMNLRIVSSGGESTDASGSEPVVGVSEAGGPGYRDARAAEGVPERDGRSERRRP